MNKSTYNDVFFLNLFCPYFNLCSSELSNYVTKALLSSTLLFLLSFMSYFVGENPKEKKTKNALMPHTTTAKMLLDKFLKIISCSCIFAIVVLPHGKFNSGHFMKSNFLALDRYLEI